MPSDVYRSKHIFKFWRLVSLKTNLATDGNSFSSRLSEIGIVKIPSNFFPQLYLRYLLLHYPDIWPLVSNESVVGFIELQQKKDSGSYGEGGQNNGTPRYPPIRDSKPFGWFLFGFSIAAVGVGFWCTFIFARYQFYVKRVLLGITCVMLGISMMLVSAMLMFHGLSLPLHPVPCH